jgi:lysophospholipase L1-like esterase
MRSAWGRNSRGLAVAAMCGGLFLSCSGTYVKSNKIEGIGKNDRDFEGLNDTDTGADMGVEPGDAEDRNREDADRADTDIEESDVNPIVEESGDEDLAMLEGKPLEQFFVALANLQSSHHRHVRVLHYGDSHTAADVLTSAMRRIWQKRFGDGGRGFVLAGRPWPSYKPLHLTPSTQGVWETKRVLFGVRLTGQDHLLGLAGVAIDGAQPGARAAMAAESSELPKQAFSNFELFYLKKPGGGSFSVFADDAYCNQVSTAAQEIGPGFFKKSFRPGLQQFDVRLTGDGPVRLFGAVLETNANGVVLDSLGINGAFYDTPQRWDLNLLQAHVGHRAPSLVIIMYGTNDMESGSLTKEVYAQQIKETVTRLRAGAPHAACLLIGPPDRELKKFSKSARGRLDWIIETQRTSAVELGCAFLDTQKLMGGQGSYRLWAKRGWALTDGVHFSARGYVKLGTSIARQVLSAYDRFIAGQKTHAAQNLARVGLSQVGSCMEHNTGGQDECSQFDHP